MRLRSTESERDPAHPLRGHSSTPRRHDSPEAATAYLTFPRLFKEADHSVSIHTALILAGGESRRFGGPKALVEIAGRPLIAHIADAMASLAGETIVSVEGSEGEASIRSILSRAVFVHDERHGRGPIEGFRQGFRAGHGDLVLVAPCDAPFLRAPLYRRLLEVLGDHDVAVPKLEVLDPVRAVYRRERVLEVLEASHAVRSPSALVDRLDFVSIGPDQIREVDPDLSSFVEVNTRTDLDEVLQKRRTQEDARGTD